MVVAFILYGGKCPKCDELLPEFEVVSACFSVDNKNEPSYTESGFVKDKPFFFISFEFTQDRKNIFVDFNVNRVPTVAWLKPEVANPKTRKL